MENLILSRISLEKSISFFEFGFKVCKCVNMAFDTHFDAVLNPLVAKQLFD